MKKLLIVGVALVALLFPTAAVAYDGRGSDNLPCETGGYWVLVHLESDPPTLSVDGTTATLVKVVGDGKTAHYESGPVSATSVVVVTPDVGQLQLSHCVTPTPSPSPSPTPTPSPSPSATPTTSPSASPTLPPTDTDATAATEWGTPADFALLFLFCFSVAFTAGFFVTSLSRKR